MGGLDDNNISGMSGGWEFSFSLGETADLELEFLYRLTIDSDYESDEYGEMRISLDDTETLINRLTGNGNGGSDDSFQEIRTITFQNVDAGPHKLVFGAYNNKKTWNNEVTVVQLGSVTLTGGTVVPTPPTPVTPAPVPPTPVTPAPVPPTPTPPVIETYVPGDLTISVFE